MNKSEKSVLSLKMCKIRYRSMIKRLVKKLIVWSIVYFLRECNAMKTSHSNSQNSLIRMSFKLYLILKRIDET